MIRQSNLSSCYMAVKYAQTILEQLTTEASIQEVNDDLQFVYLKLLEIKEDLEKQELFLAEAETDLNRKD